MRFLFALVLMFLFLGCTTKVPVSIKYKIDSTPNIEISANSKCSKQSLKIMQSFSSSLLMSPEMYYVEDSNKIYAYSQAQWAKTPNRIVSDEYFEMLRKLKLFKAVLNSKSRTRTTWILESKLEDFMQYYENENSNSYVKVSINLTLLDAKSLKVIATEVFTSRLDTETLDANGGVSALNEAVSDILQQSSSWFIKECK